jgi:hypothetical protein
METVWSGLTPQLRDLLRDFNASERPMPLVSPRKLDPQAARLLPAAPAALANALQPEAALAGLHLLAGDWEKAHEIAQDLASPEGSYWHAIVHRTEPDDWNSGYWFRRVGVHPIFPDLLHSATSLAHSSGVAWNSGSRWDPLRFIEFCERARRHPGSAEEALAEEIQRAEWRLLFGWCAQGA